MKNQDERKKENRIRLKQSWETLITAYKETVECSSYGMTGDPRKTIACAAGKGVGTQELREVLAVIAKIKPHDGRFSASNRNWLYAGLDFDAGDWYMEYGYYMGHLDDIHTTHLDNLASTLRYGGPK